MCITPDNDAAEQARRREQERQRKIEQGRGRIDSAFSDFGDEYYAGLKDDYTGYYMPKIEDQYNDARESLVFDLSRSGNLQSSAGATQLAELDEAFAKQQAAYQDKAEGFVSDAKGNVQNAQHQLYTQLSQSADPAAAARASAARAEQLSAPPEFSPIGDLFGKFAQQGSNTIAAERAGYKGAGLGLQPPKLRSSERVVR